MKKPGSSLLIQESFPILLFFFAGAKFCLVGRFDFHLLNDKVGLSNQRRLDRFI